jgi:hypothetical protein
VNSSVINQALEFLDLHYEAFYAAEPHAAKTGHPVPVDTRSWSQILVSLLSDIKGLERGKGADLDDGSDVKGANTWTAIDTPRFNGVIKAGTKADTSGRIESLDAMPHLYFVLWDETIRNTARCRIWVVRPDIDTVFRAMCQDWYNKRDSGLIRSGNFQLHPPRGLDVNVFRNRCGNLIYPRYFCAERASGCKYELIGFNPELRETGRCSLAQP